MLMHEVMNCRQAHPSSSPKCALGIRYLVSGMAQSDAGRSEGKEGITRVWAKVNSTMSKGLTGHLVCVSQRLIQSFEYVHNVVLKTWQYFSNSIKKMQHENPVQCWLNNHSNKPFYQHYIKKSTWCKTCSHLGTSRWQHTTLQNALKSFLLCRWQADEATMFSFVRNGL